MEEEEFKILRSKKFLTPHDVLALILICDRLIERNRLISAELRAALENVENVNNRLQFYRAVTMRKEKC